MAASMAAGKCRKHYQPATDVGTNNKINIIKADYVMVDDIKHWLKLIQQTSVDYITEALEDIVDALAPYKDQELVFVSFSDVPKLGINPKTGYNTPAGIYSYPLKQMWPSIQANTIPYAGERKYVLVLQPRGNQGIVDIATYTASEFSQHMRLLQQKVIPQIVGSTVVDPGFFDDFFDEAKRESKQQTPAGWLWNITRLLATMWERDFRGPKPTVGWNAIMRALNISGVVDREGSGLIHPNEPTQAVWFSANNLNLLSISRNIRKTSISRQSQLALLRKNPDNIWGIHHPDREMWDIALSQDAGALIRKATQQNQRIPFGALLQASKVNMEVAHWLIRDGYKLNSQQKIAIIKSNPNAPDEFVLSPMWNDQLARAAIESYPNMLDLIDRHRGVPSNELIELATRLHPQDAVWAAKHLKDLSPQTKNNIIGHIGPETWTIWRRWTEK